MQLFHYLSVVFVLGGIGSALVIVIDLHARRQPMRIMHSVWVLTGLWASFFGLWAYFAFGRAPRNISGNRMDSTTKGKTGRENTDMPGRVDLSGVDGMELPGTGSMPMSAGMKMSGMPDMSGAEGMKMPGMTRMQVSDATEMPGTGSMPMSAGMEMPDMNRIQGSDTTEMPGRGGMPMSAGMEMPDMNRMRGADATEMPGRGGMPMSAGMEMPKMTRMQVSDAMKLPDRIDLSGADGMEMPERVDISEADGMNMPRMEMPVRPKWQSVVLSTLHCGAGCTLADIVGEWALYFVPVAIGSSLLAGTWVTDYLLALLFGIGFQYAAIRGMEPSIPRGEAVGRAAKADILSLTAWQAGMYGWMAVAIFAFGNGMPMPRTTFMFWFMMQVAMACGFLLSLPVNVLLIRKGIKKGM